MVLSTVLNLAFIPVLYVLLKSFLESFSKRTPPAAGEGSGHERHELPVEVV
jgi:HAE1 family hydrophobic/amphiphilic exporter-1